MQRAWLKLVSILMITLLATACGGGGGGFDDDDDGTGGTGGTGGSTPSAHHLAISVGNGQLDSDDDLVTEGLTVTVSALDSNNNTIPGVPIAFTSDCTSLGLTCAATNADGALFPANTVTDINGTLTAVLTTAGNPDLRTITVTTANGSAMISAAVSVVNPGTGTATVLRMGSFSGPTFNNNAIAVGTSPLSAAGSSGLSLAIVDQTDAPFAQSVDVTFNSTCIANGQAEIQPSNPINTTTGAVNVTYVDKGCGAPPAGTTDNITATAAANSQSLSATGSILVQPAAVGSIQFVSANPTIMGLRGGGSSLPEQSIVTFKLLSTGGGPVSNTPISFSLSNTVGGITFANGSTTATANTGQDGTVTVTVLSGTALTTLRVTATTTTTPVPLTTQSSNLFVSTGFPDQNSFSLSASGHNIAGLTTDGTEVTLTIRASDRNNNPAPDLTPIVFTTEGGDIESGCFTTDGACTVIWESQNPRPQPLCNNVAGDGIPGNAAHPDCENDGESSVISSNGALRGGRSTVLAYTTGEESFLDLNGNGLFDNGDNFSDLPEAFLDINENGARQATAGPPAILESFVDYVSTEPTSPYFVTGTYNSGDTAYNGQLCQHPTSCSIDTTFTVRESQVIVMSGPAVIRIAGTNISDFDDTTIIDDDQSSAPAQETINFCETQLVTFSVVLRDSNFQPLAAGTEVSIVTTLGSVEGRDSHDVQETIDDTRGANTVTFTLKSPGGTNPDSGVVELTITDPAVAGGGGGGSSTLQFPAVYTPALCTP